jgi:hypothetical protein
MTDEPNAPNPRKAPPRRVNITDTEQKLTRVKKPAGQGAAMSAPIIEQAARVFADPTGGAAYGIP